MTLPSWRTVVLLLIALVIGGVFVVGPLILKNKVTFTQDGARVGSGAQSITSLDADSDGDGLVDWEEFLIGTDPHNPDTDGDGILDSAEADSVSFRSASQKISEAYKREVSATDRLTQDFLTYYYQSMLQYDSPSEAPPRSYPLLEYTSIGENTYREDSLTVTPDNSDNALRAYGVSMARTLVTYKVPTGNELDIVLESINTENEEVMKELDPIIARYKSLVDELARIEVPSNLVNFHLDFINSYAVMHESMQALRDLHRDPVAAMVGLDVFTRSAQELRSALLEFSTFLESGRIPFSSKESINTFAAKTAADL